MKISPVNTISVLLVAALLLVNVLPVVSASGLCPMGDKDSGKQMSCCVARATAVETQLQRTCCCDFSERQETPVESSGVVVGNESVKREFRQQTSLQAGQIQVLAGPQIHQTVKSRYSTCNSHPPTIPIYTFVSSFLI